MAAPQPLRTLQARIGADRTLLVALLLSAVLHGGVLYGAARWGPCICNFGKVVCPKIGQDCHPQVALKLVDAERPEPPPPPPPAKPAPKPAPSITVEKPRPEKPPAAPKAGAVVLPEEALRPASPEPAEIKLERPSLPEDVVVRESEAGAPVIATGEIFGRADALIPGAPGLFGLGGTGTGIGIGPFGVEKDGGGVGGPAAPAPRPEPAPPPPPQPARPRGPTRPPKVLNWTDPPYPEPARQQGVEGTVALKLTVSAEGRAQHVRTAESSGHSALDQAAIVHIKQARFSPALKDGRAVPATITFRVKFRLVNS